MAMGLIDELRRRIGRGTWEDGAARADWRESLAALRDEPGVTDADIARAVRQLVQGRTASGALEEPAAVRALAQRLFVETARVSPRSLIAVPMLLDLVEAGRGTLEEALLYAESVTNGVS